MAKTKPAPVSDPIAPPPELSLKQEEIVVGSSSMPATPLSPISSEPTVNYWIESNSIPFGSIMNLHTSDEVLACAMSVAQRLRDLLEETVDSEGRPLLWHLYSFTNKKTHEVVNTRHPRAEAWELGASLIGCTLSILGTEWRPDIGSVGAWAATGAVIRNIDGAVIATAESLCGFDETIWGDRPHYAVKGMAETRAASRAGRTAFGFLFKLAGFEATGAEEVGYTGANETATEETKGVDAIPQTPTTFDAAPAPVAMPKAAVIPESQDPVAVQDMMGRLLNVAGGMGVPEDAVSEFINDVVNSFGPVFVDNEDFYNAALVVANRIQDIPTQEQVEEELVLIAKMSGQTEEG